MSDSNSNNSSSMEWEPEQEEAPSSCTDCGECPILGTRYHSVSSKQGVMVCQLCLQENHSEDADSFEKCQSSKPSPGHAVANGMEGLIQLLDPSKQPPIGEVDLYLSTRSTTPPPDTARLCSALQENTSLKSLQVFIRGNANLGVAVHALALALQQSRSVVLVRFSVCASQQQGRADRMALALQTLLETNPKLRYFYFRTLSRFGLHGVNPYVGQDLVADRLFDGLHKSRLKRFIYDGHCPVSDANQQKAIAAIQSNPHLRSIQANFDDDDTSELEFVTGNKNREWIQRWTGETTSQKEWMQVLEEILQAPFADKTSAFFRLFRAQPRLIIIGS